MEIPMNPLLEFDSEEVTRKVDLSPLKGKAVVVLGANGLVGSQIIRTLKFYSDNVADIKIQGLSLNAKDEDLLPSGISYESVDLTKFHPRGACDYLINCSSYAQPSKFLSDPSNAIELNTSSVWRTLNSGAFNYLYCSSAEIYGDNAMDVRESYNGSVNTIDPRAVYAESKRMGETLCALAHRQRVANVKIARMCSFYGPGIPKGDTRVLPSLFEKARNGRIDLMDSGEQVRTWCYITDGVAMMLNIMLYGKELVYNVGGSDTLSIKQLADKIGKLYGVPVTASKEKTELSKGPSYVRLCCRRYKEEFGPGHPVGMDEGLSRIKAIGDKTGVQDGRLSPPQGPMN